ncbi:MAG: hypothetical protein E4H38_05125 [Gemmatimonadales bacterium]|nr:MAG: hypothetical protein E4H38_05125 [Gemmatimonadales bacterium]
MTPARLAALALLLAGCSDLTSTGKNAVALRVLLPSPAAVEPGDTLQLHAQAIDINGDSIPGAAIYWRTPDTTIDMVDSIGLVTTALTSGSGRVQARHGSLFSELQTLSIRRASDTLILTGATFDTVAAGDTASHPLSAAVLSLTPDTAGIDRTRITFALLDSLSGVHFAGDVSILGAVTGPSGEPAPAVTLRRSGPAVLGTVRVAVSATRPSGTPVPSQNPVFTITFQ